MQIRPHLDYCDIIYHKPANTNNPEHYLSLNYLMNSLEKIQYEVALAITGTWKGSNTDKLYEELGWESLHHRRIFRRLTMFYKIHNNLTPIFLKHPLQMSQQSYALRGTCNLPSISARTDRYRHSFYPDAVDLWNKLDASIKNSPSLSIFKTSFLKLIRPARKETFNISDPEGIKWLFQLRVGLSPLKSHKKRHNFQDSICDLCECTFHPETTAHFFLACPRFIIPRRALMNTINPLLTSFKLNNVRDDELVRILLYGNNSFNFTENKVLLKATINFMRLSNRFSE